MLIELNLLTYFKSLDLWMLPIFLALFCVGIALPFRIVISLTSFRRRMSARHFVLINPILEELVFRLGLLVFLVPLFGLLEGVLLTTVIYMVYVGVFYGPPMVADALVTGIVLSFAFFEFGILIVVATHIIYRAVAGSFW